MERPSGPVAGLQRGLHLLVQRARGLPHGPAHEPPVAQPGDQGPRHALLAAADGHQPRAARRQRADDRGLRGPRRLGAGGVAVHLRRAAPAAGPGVQQRLLQRGPLAVEGRPGHRQLQLRQPLVRHRGPARLRHRHVGHARPRGLERRDGARHQEPRHGEALLPPARRRGGI